jgi:hypothetical protein
MNPTQEQDLKEEVKRRLTEEIPNDPTFWAEWITNRMSKESMVEYLDLNNAPEEITRQTIESLGFDPRENKPTRP